LLLAGRQTELLCTSAIDGGEEGVEASLLGFGLEE
jgi:hypothetical protein